MIEPNLILAAMPFTGRLRPETTAKIGQSLSRSSFAPRTILLQPGDKVSGAYFVSAGAIRIYYVDEEGREGTLYRIEPGESCILALNSLFSAMPYPAWAEADDEGVDCLVLDGSAARHILADDEHFMNALFEQVSTRLYDMLQELERVIRMPLEKRLAGLLLDLADGSGLVALSQERLASHLGTSREVISRLMRTLTAANVLHGGYGQVRIIDADALRNIAS